MNRAIYTTLEITKMNPILRAGLIATTLLAAPAAAHAGLILAVSQDSSSSANLNALSPGEQVKFDVSLSGLDIASNQQIGTLGATLAFDSNLLGMPLSIVPGSIVPDTSAFLTSPAAGIADASYSDVFSSTNESIATNGLFFQFTVVAQSVFGSGNLSVSFVDAFDPNFNSIPISSGPELSFQVTPQSGAVPEPGTFFLLASAAVLLTFCQVRLTFVKNVAGRLGRDYTCVD
jgi:hypothetical protein